NQPFVVALGDSIIGRHAKSDIVHRMLQEFDRTKADVVVAFEEVPRTDVFRYGIAEPAGEVGDVFELKSLVEKPPVDEAPSNLAVAARYVFSPAIFDALATQEPGKGGEIQLTDAIQSLLSKGAKGIGMRLKEGERRFDIGNYESYFRAFLEFALTDDKHGGSLRAFVRELLDNES
ncbi:MAG: hypothetical protein KDA60_14860, partial [Planctomycetales bacterium]|nr:hypothetical protein [Planctomycetales bacterium]